MVMCVVTSPCLSLVLIKALLLRNKNSKYNCTFFIYVLHIFLYIHTGFGFYSCVANRIRTRIRIPTSWIGTEVGLKKTWLRTPLAIVTFSDPDSSPVPKFLNWAQARNFFKFENPTAVQTPATIDATESQQCFYWSNDVYTNHADSCYCQK